MKKNLVLGVVLSLSFPAVSMEMPDVKEGLWEISSQVNIAALPIKIPPQVMQRCFTKQSMNPQNILQQNNCQMNNMDIQAHSVRWQMSCQQEGMQMQGQGHIQYQQTAFSGTFDMTMSGAPEGAMAMHTKISGQYIGKCA